MTDVHAGPGSVGYAVDLWRLTVANEQNGTMGRCPENR